MEFGQPKPIKNELPAAWQLVLDDLSSTGECFDTVNNPYGAEYLDITQLALRLILISMLKNGEKDADIRKAMNRLKDICKQRDEFGEKKYGTRLQPHNGRDSLADCIEEIMDLLVYFRTFQYERLGK